MAKSAKQKAVKVHVTKNHIDDGQAEAEFCPIALALQGALFNSNISVDGSSIQIDIGGDGESLEREVDLPKKLKDFVKKFDAVKEQLDSLEYDRHCADEINDTKEIQRIDRAVKKLKFPKPFSFTFLAPQVIELDGAIRL